MTTDFSECWYFPMMFQITMIFCGYLIGVRHAFRNSEFNARHEVGHTIVGLASTCLQVHYTKLTSPLLPFSEEGGRVVFGGIDLSGLNINSSASLWECGALVSAGEVAVQSDMGCENDLENFGSVARELVRRQSAGEDIRPPWQTDAVRRSYSAADIREFCLARASELLRQQAGLIEPLIEALLRQRRLDCAEIDIIVASQG
ncbi:MAG: hypothetical protein WCT10_02945 [Patescibacteria group bacterium]|jgi:hypothetical protein